MKYGFMLIIGFLTTSCLRAEEQTAVEAVVEQTGDAAVMVEAATPTEIKTGQWLPPAIVTFGDVDGHLAVRAQAWAEENLAIPVELLPAQQTIQVGTLDEVSQIAASMLETNRIGLVVLWRPNSEAKNHGAYYPDVRVAVANLNPMFTPDTDAETIERRIERQVIRGICHIFGLEPSPNPLSAMYAYSELAELDVIGRNLDPPWLKRLQERAVEEGITVNADSIYNMLQ